ncbi:MAG: tRNA pseudouridine(55) synthase TruB [Candidatus Merdivicinus sp.]|jgi:tRNA pseudouridine55 synthase
MSKRPDTNLSGILCINKPQDFTSFDVIAKLRGISGTRKIGHSGTLDPMATGVLPIFFGIATKACDLLPNHDKRYTAGIRFGCVSDTQDIWGNVQKLETKPVTLPELEASLPYFTGSIAQIPPMFSAVQVNGQRLYDLARKGIEVERKARNITIYQLNLLAFDSEKQEALLDISCSKGTYIRTLCHDLGQMLGTGAVMSSLTRTEAAGFTLENCISLEQAQQAALEQHFADLLLPVGQAFSDLPAIILNDIQARMFQNGVRLDLNRISFAKIGGDHAVYNRDHEFLGIAACNFDEMELTIRKIFCQRS